MVERYVMNRGQLQPEYHVLVVGVMQFPALERKLRDVGNMEYVLVPRRLVSDGKSARGLIHAPIIARVCGSGSCCRPTCRVARAPWMPRPR